MRDNIVALKINHPIICSRSSRPEVFCKKGVLKNSTKFIGKNLCQSLFFNFNFIKKETLEQVISYEFFEISKNTFFIEHLWWLLPMLYNIQVLLTCNLTRMRIFSLFSLFFIFYILRLKLAIFKTVPRGAVVQIIQ